MRKTHQIILVVTALFLLFGGLGRVIPVNAQSSGNNDVLSRLDALESRISTLEAENAQLQEKIDALTSQDTIMAKTIILQGETGSVYIAADESGPRIKFISSDNMATLDLGVLSINVDDDTPSPNIVMSKGIPVGYVNKMYSINLYINDNGPGFQYWGNNPPDYQAMRPLAQFYPENLALMDSWLSAEQLAGLTGIPSPSETGE